MKFEASPLRSYPNFKTTFKTIVITIALSVLGATSASAIDSTGTTGTKGPLTVNNGVTTTIKKSSKTRLGVVGPLRASGTTSTAQLSSNVIVVTPTVVTSKNASTITTSAARIQYSKKL